MRAQGDGNIGVRILHVTHAGVLSGAEIAVARLVGELKFGGTENIVGVGDEGSLASALRDEGVQVEVVSLPASLADRRSAQLRGIAVLGTIPGTLLYALRIFRTARKQRVDIIHTNSMKAHVAGMLAGRLARIPVLTHLRDDLTQLHTGRGVLSLLFWLLRRVPATVVGCSQHVLDVAGFGGVPAHVIYSGVPTKILVDSLPSREGEPVVGMVARIAEWKGQHLFLDAAEIVARAHPGVRFRIVGAPMFGEDAYLQHLERLAGRVEFAGYAADPIPQYDEFAVAVACSIQPEPFGQVVIEAMARGCAVVAPTEGGPREVITSEVDGLLIPPRNADALAAAILRLLNDTPIRDGLGKAAVETVRARFTVEATARAFTAVINDVVVAA
jgi:glycosyltransferase involved in cell wall biosynthesis